MCCSGPGWPALDSLWGKVFLVWTPESFHDYLNLYPNLENALCFVSSVDGNSGDDGGTTVTDPAGVFIQTFDGLDWTSPVTADEISRFDARVRSGVLTDCKTIGHSCLLSAAATCRCIIVAHQRSCVICIRMEQYKLPRLDLCLSCLTCWPRSDSLLRVLHSLCATSRLMVSAPATAAVLAFVAGILLKICLGAYYQQSCVSA